MRRFVPQFLVNIMKKDALFVRSVCRTVPIFAGCVISLDIVLRK